MTDKKISAVSVAAGTAWALSLGLWGLAWIISSDDIGRLSLIVCGVAVTATIRSYLVTQDERIRTALAVTSVVRDSVTSLPTRR